ncbi:MAG: CoA pyrophosphatase [Acidobacteria bacterium]|nr:CoA pyrophosphatase [Acidobacteriota bacterium]MBI3424677.1 CoA pyrophosphatase [Acidobacteriota bacterium]
MKDFAADNLAAPWQGLQARLLRLEHLPIEPARIAQAAVTLILRAEQSEAQALIIKRAEHPHDPWSGHLALPGGRADDIDEDLLATAARETLEEIGLNLHAGGQFLGRLPKLSPKNPRLPQLEITPFVALAPAAFKLQFSAEVADAFWISLPQLKQEGMSSRHTWTVDGVERAWPAYPSSRGPIWGITGRILNDFLNLFE